MLRSSRFVRSVLRLAPLALLATVCAGAAPAVAAEAVRDPHSYSRPELVAVTHLDLDLAVDFAAKRLTGTAALTIERRDAKVRELVLDTRDLEIASVTLDDAKEPARFSLGEADPLHGRALTIALGAATKRVTIAYRTSPEAAAVQWLEPAQTAGGRLPFVFTQSEAILARSWVPCQDSPGVRMTYAATIRVPPTMLALMSATNPQAKSADGVYRFEMTRSIPSYLLALAAGELEFRALGPRSGVYAEPPVVAGAAYELADTEAMITAAEKLYGPYRWERYDLLVLPPSFPFGGMENPRLTFATPTILAGDRSLVSLVAHELAHSWSGNLVTNATWNDFWLNEGVTTYLENRIVEAVYGADRAAMIRQLERQEIEEGLARLGAAQRGSWLYADLKDPDDYESAIPYEKGALFLHTLERAVGRERFDAFLRGYFDRHAFRSITTAEFVAELKADLLDRDPAAAKAVPIDAWIYGPGVPTGAAVATTTAFDKVDRELTRFGAGTKAAELETAGWVTQQWLHFLEKLPPLPKEKLAELDAAFGFTRSGNSEILCEWFLIAIRTGYEPAYPALESFLSRVGRRKFLSPLYTELAKTPAGLARAKAIYAKARPGYHPLGQVEVDRIVGKPN